MVKVLIDWYCEIENEKLAQALIGTMEKQDVYTVAQYLDSPDIRGIDTCLMYSKDVFRFDSAKRCKIDLIFEGCLSDKFIGDSKQ